MPASYRRRIRQRRRDAGDDVRAHLGTICNLRYQGWTADSSQWIRPLSRLLVLLTTLLLLVMPVTEHLCNWDRFLRGGPDVEFSLLAALLFAAMVVLSMSGTIMQPLMMQPLMMQPAFATANGPCGQATPRAVAQRGSSRRAASIPSRSPGSRLLGLDDPASISGSRTLTLLRI
jgi:hypothetical protein